MLFTYTVCLVLFRAVRLTERLGQSDKFLQAEAGTKHAQKNCYFWFFMCVNCSACVRKIKHLLKKDFIFMLNANKDIYFRIYLVF